MTAAMKLVMKPSGPTDTELVRRLLSGDEEAFAEGEDGPGSILLGPSLCSW